MGGSPQLPAPARIWFAPAWLPPGGRGNGLASTELSADGWAPIADVDLSDVDLVLQALRSAAVPAYCAPVGRTREAIAHHSQRRRWRVWVASLRYAVAEQVLLSTLNRLAENVKRDC